MRCYIRRTRREHVKHHCVPPNPRACQRFDILQVLLQGSRGFWLLSGFSNPSDYPDVKVILVSDRPDAQEAARKAGAVDGFGKADLGSGKIATVLHEALKAQGKPN